MRKTFLFLIMLSAAAAIATTVVAVSVERLAQSSSAVVLARAIDARSEWNAEHTRIYTYTRFQVSRHIKGQTAGVVTVKQLGGKAGGYTQKVAGVRGWNPGDEAVLFLHASPESDGTLVVTGLMQGDFAVRRSPSGEVTVSNGAPGVTAFDAQAGQVNEYRGTRMTLQELETRVQKAVQQ